MKVTRQFLSVFRLLRIVSWKLFSLSCAVLIFFQWFDVKYMSVSNVIWKIRQKIRPTEFHLAKEENHFVSFRIVLTNHSVCKKEVADGSNLRLLPSFQSRFRDENRNSQSSVNLLSIHLQLKVVKRWKDFKRRRRVFFLSTSASTIKDTFDTDIYFTSDHWQKRSTTQDKLQSFQETIRSKRKTLKNWQVTFIY